MWENREYQILVVEDNTADAFLLKHFINEIEGFRGVYTMATDVNEACEALDNQVFDLMFLDLGLPGYFGEETIDEMEVYLDKVPTIVLTGNLDRELGKRVITKGAQGYVCKDDYDNELLKKTILMAIDNFKRMKNSD